MKKEFQAKTDEALVQNYPITDWVDGWYFKFEEISNSVYRITGTDPFGRKVSETGTNEKELIDRCKTQTKEIINKIRNKQHLLTHGSLKDALAPHYALVSGEAGYYTQKNKSLRGDQIQNSNIF